MKGYLRQLEISLAKLPAVGPRSARKIALFLAENKTALIALRDICNDVNQHTIKCKICGLINDEELCYICSDNKRNTAKVCIVQNNIDLYAIERSGAYDGLYYVVQQELIGENIMKRITEKIISEVIVAVAPTLNGKIIVHQIFNILSKFSVKVSELAMGIPVGAEFDYLDSETLSAAFHSRVNGVKE